MTNPSAAWVYLVTAPVCVLLPFAVPADARPLPVVLAVGLPLSILAILFATIHRQHRLDGSGYRIVASAFALGAAVTVSPLGYWVESIAVYRVLSIVHMIVPIVTASALIWLTIQMWRLPSKFRVVLAVGVGSIAFRFAWTAYEVIFNEPGLEETSESLAFFMIDCAIDGSILLIGIVGHWLLTRRLQSVSS